MLVAATEIVEIVAHMVDAGDWKRGGVERRGENYEIW